MAPKSFREIIQQYHDEHIVFYSPRKTGPAPYLIESVDESGFAVRNLKSGRSTLCQFSVQTAAIKELRLHGHLPIDDLSDSPAITSTILQSAECGLSPLRKQVHYLPNNAEVYSRFHELLRELRVHRDQGVPKLYKPVIMWCIFDALKSGDLKENHIRFDWLVPRFLKKFNELGISGNEQNAAEAFFHLTSDTFWLLAYHNPEQVLDETPYASKLRQQVSHAIIKETFWKVLSSPKRLEKLKSLIEKEWFSFALGASHEPSQSLNINLDLLDLAVKRTIRPFLIDLNKLNDLKSEGDRSAVDRSEVPWIDRMGVIPWPRWAGARRVGRRG